MIIFTPKNTSFAPPMDEHHPDFFLPACDAPAFSIVWEEFGGADDCDPTYDRDEILDAIAFQEWLDAKADNDEWA